jgi:uncharacterized membrane protein
MTLFTMRRSNVRSVYRRGLIAIALVSAVLIVGTIGFHLIEGSSIVDSFYFISMLATAQGPATTPSTAAGKIFSSAMAFVSVGTVVAALGFLFGPFFGAVWREGVLKAEEEEARLKEREEAYRARKEKPS